ncbi:MAG: Hsp20/alpha crystallin family protein, partial [Nitrospirae bacterium]|nr:Hsp20/alpha crystallin family protein [Nitrospirota bacterium]
MTLVKWSPFKELTAIQERMNKFMGDPLLKFPFEFTGNVEGVDWVPAVDIYETDQAITLKAELPEMDLKDIDISVEGRTLQIKGDRKLEKEETRENYHRVERVYGSFNRFFSLPETVDTDKI